MNPQRPRDQFRAGRLRPRVVAAVCGLAWLASAAWAGVPVPSSDGNYYSRQRDFEIPFSGGQGAGIVRIFLWYSTDKGATWQKGPAANPSDEQFDFKARRDGWHWFAVQTQDQQNRLHPASMEGAAPMLKVFVDTLPPSVTLRGVATERQGDVAVEWDIQDETLDLSTLKLSYRLPGGKWLPLNVQRQPSGSRSWTPGSEDKIEVRLEVMDRAGNLGVETITVSTRGVPTGNAKRPQPRQQQDDRGLEETPVRKINSTKIKLNYKIDNVGPSEVSTIDVYYYVEPQGWKKYPRPAPRNPPFEVTVEGEGRYGFSLLARSGVGLSDEPPRGKDPPQLWVEVDLTKPEVKLLGTEVREGSRGGEVTVRWEAKDKNLSRQPISLFYAAKKDGPWLPVPSATNLENDGIFVWPVGEGVPYQFYMKVEAIDEAGNIGAAETEETVKVDLKKPRARVIGVEPAKP